jgi:hypothetical protein
MVVIMVFSNNPYAPPVNFPSAHRLASIFLSIPSRAVVPEARLPELVAALRNGAINVPQIHDTINVLVAANVNTDFTLRDGVWVAVTKVYEVDKSLVPGNYHTITGAMLPLVRRYRFIARAGWVAIAAASAAAIWSVVSGAR